MNAPAFTSSANASIDLSGQWTLLTDTFGQGLAGGWMTKPPMGADLHTVTLPGDLASQGVGEPIRVDTPWTGSIFDRAWFTAPEYATYRSPDNIKVPFWLQPELLHVGPAWYWREFEVPAETPAGALRLELERPHWRTRVWIDGTEVGTDESLSTPHCFLLREGLAPGRHLLCLRIDNSGGQAIGENSHSISDHTQGNWNGVIGTLRLVPLGHAWIEDLALTPHTATRTLTVRGRLAMTRTRAAAASPYTKTPLRITVAADQGAPAYPVVQAEALAFSDGVFELSIQLPAEAALWDEFSPALHRVEVTGADITPASARTGLRTLGTQGTLFTINGRPFVVRGTLDCAIFPKTGHPPVDTESWRGILRTIKAHGLNTVRFHSWCPPEAAFIAGDEEGLYFQIEAGSWPNWSTTLGDGHFVDGWLEAEGERILRAFGNHPCFVFFAAGNEPGGDKAGAYLARWNTRMRSLDARHLITGCSAWPEIAENDFHVLPDPRIQAWGQGLASRINALPPETRTDYRDFIARRTVPVVSHEIGQWCVFPDLGEATKYTGVLRPRNFEIFRDRLRAHHLEHQARDFLLASGKLQVLCYKEDIEAALRTPGMAGFHLLGLQDFPGQGTALVGMLNPFWESKGYLDAAEHARFCNTTVPLARLDKRVFRSCDTLAASLEISHFGAAPLVAARPRWALLNAEDGTLLRSGELPARDIPVGGPTLLGELALPLAGLPAPSALRLRLSLAGTAISNDWALWLYPNTNYTTAPLRPARGAARPAKVHTVRSLGAAEEAVLAAGGTVLLMPPPATVRGDARGRVQLGFSSVFWNTAWTNGQAPHTLGILCDPAHPALASFPTESHSNWQWWHIVTEASAMILDGLPPALRPIVQVIDDWFTCRKLGLVFEARCGGGRLIVCSVDLTKDEDPVRRQLLASLQDYAAGPAPKDLLQLEPAQVRGLFE